MKKAPKPTIDAELLMLRTGIAEVLARSGFSPRELQMVRAQARVAREQINEFVRARECGEFDRAALHAYRAGRAAQLVFDVDNFRDSRDEGRVDRKRQTNRENAKIMVAVGTKLTEWRGDGTVKELHAAIAPTWTASKFSRVLTDWKWKKTKAAIQAKFRA